MKLYFQANALFQLFLLCSFLFFPSASEAVLWNKIVAGFDDSVLTLWDVKRELGLRRVQQKIPLAAPVTSMTPTPPPITKDELRETAKTMIVEMLVISEAESFNIGALAESEVAGIFSKFQRSFASKHDFQSFVSEYLWTENELKRVLARPIHVERFIKEKILSAYIYITDEEIVDWLRDHKGMKKEAARERLRKRRLYENLKDWITNLKNRSNVRVILD